MTRKLKPKTGFAARLIEARGGMSREQFAKLLGVPVTTLGNWERGDTEPPQDVLVRIHQALSVSLDWLLTGDDPSAPPADLAAAFDEDLLGLVVEGILAVYAEANARLPHRELGRLAARTQRDVLAACEGDTDPGARKAALRMALQQLRRDLQAPASDGQSKRRA